MLSSSVSIKVINFSVASMAELKLPPASDLEILIATVKKLALISAWSVWLMVASKLLISLPSM